MRPLLTRFTLLIDESYVSPLSDQDAIRQQATQMVSDERVQFVIATLLSAHAWQVEQAERPDTAANEPSAQLAQMELPCTGAYLPGTHAIHEVLEDSPMIDEYVPVAHCVHAVLCVVCSYVPAGHGVQSERPWRATAVALYVPAGHDSHVWLDSCSK